ncbi:HAD family hydrolase, partial [bacterium]|nr:HAD family hydrolase [bacterium]
LVPHAQSVLQQLARRHELVLTTLRRSPEPLARQLDRLGIRELFHSVFSGAGEASGLAKANLIRNYSSVPTGWLVGDSEADILAARALGLRCCAVTWGIRSRSYLAKLHPQALAGDMRELPQLVN